MRILLGNTLLFLQTCIMFLTIFATAWAIDWHTRHIENLPGWAKEKPAGDLPSPLENWRAAQRILIAALIAITILATTGFWLWIESLP